MCAGALGTRSGWARRRKGIGERPSGIFVNPFDAGAFAVHVTGLPLRGAVIAVTQRPRLIGED